MDDVDDMDDEIVLKGKVLASENKINSTGSMLIYFLLCIPAFDSP